MYIYAHMYIHIHSFIVKTKHAHTQTTNAVLLALFLAWSHFSGHGILGVWRVGYSITCMHTHACVRMCRDAMFQCYALEASM